MHSVTFNRRRLCARAPAAVLLLALCLLAVGVQALPDSPALAINEPGRYTLDHDLSPGSSIGVLITSSDVVFDGMGYTIEGIGGNGTGVYVTGLANATPGGPITNVTVRNVTVRDCGAGVYIGRVNGSVVEDVVAEQNGIGFGYGYAEQGGSEQAVLRDSVVRDSTGTGIVLDYPSDGITIERCTVTGNANGLASDLSGRLVANSLIDSEVSDNAGFGVSLKESGLIIRGCTISGNGANGIQLEHAGAEIEANRIEGNAGTGVQATNRGGSTITSNWIIGNGQGVAVGGDWSSQVTNNVLNNTDNGFFGAAEVGQLNVTRTAGPNIVGGPYLGGNAWAFPNGTGFSQTHPDTDGDGFCDEPYVVNPDEGVTDYLPLALPNAPPVGGDRGYFLVSTSPLGASIYLEDLSGTRTLQGTTGPGPLNVTVYLTGTPVRKIVATLPGHHDAFYTVTQNPPKGGTVPVSLALAESSNGTPYKPHTVPGRIEAEDYDIGGEGVAYHDTTPGNTGGAYRHDDVDIEKTAGLATPNVGWIRNGEWLSYTVNVTAAGTYTLTASVASPNSGRTVVVSVDGAAAGTIAVPNTGSFATFQTVEVPVTLAAGSHTVKLAFQGDGQNLDWIAFAAPVPTPSPYVNVTIPGTLQAEDYDLGGEGVAYHDTTPGNSGGTYRQDGVDVAPIAGGHAVVGIEDGEWLTYSIGGVSPTPQLPALVLYLGSDRDGGSVQVEVNGRVAGNVSVPNTGSPTAFKAVQTQVQAAAGTLRLRFHGSGMGMDRIESPVFVAYGDAYATPNFTTDRTNGTAPLSVHFTDMSSEWAYEWRWDFGDGTTSTERNPVHTFQRPGAYTISLNIRESDRWLGGGYLHIWNDLSHGKIMQITVEGTGPAPGHAIPGTIQAEDYDVGGEGVAYHDTTSGNSGGAYRQDDVDIETAGGVTNVGWIRNGEYLTYTANVTETGAYTLQARVASPNSGRTFAVSVDGLAATTITVPNTGSFSAFQTIEAPIRLTAGTHTLKLAFAGDGQNLDWIAFAPVGVTTPTPTPTPGAGGASFTAAPVTARHGSAVKFSLIPAAGKSISAAWWSFDAPAHLNTWNSRATSPTFFYPATGTFSPLVKITYRDGTTETVQRNGYIRAT